MPRFPSRNTAFRIQSWSDTGMVFFQPLYRTMPVGPVVSADVLATVDGVSAPAGITATQKQKTPLKELYVVNWWLKFFSVIVNVLQFFSRSRSMFLFHF